MSLSVDTAVRSVATAAATSIDRTKRSKIVRVVRRCHLSSSWDIKPLNETCNESWIIFASLHGKTSYPRNGNYRRNFYRFREKPRDASVQIVRKPQKW